MQINRMVLVAASFVLLVGCLLVGAFAADIMAEDAGASVDGLAENIRTWSILLSVGSFLMLAYAVVGDRKTSRNRTSNAQGATPSTDPKGGA